MQSDSRNNLVVLALAAAILPFGLIHRYNITGHINEAAFSRLNLISIGWLIVLTAITTVVPLALGRRKLDARDY